MCVGVCGAPYLEGDLHRTVNQRIVLLALQVTPRHKPQ
jgi:hypothetical protein